MLFPKKTKFRREQKHRKNPNKKSIATRGAAVSFGDYGLQAITSGSLSSNQIEAARRTLTRTVGKTARIWIRIFPDRPFTKKAAEVGMGKGKGNPEGFLCRSESRAVYYLKYQILMKILLN